MKLEKMNHKSIQKKIRLLYTCHSEPTVIMANKQADVGKAAKILIKEKGLQLIGLHKDMAEELNHMFGVDNTVVIRNGIDLERFRNVQEQKNDIRTELGIPEDAFVLGHVGRFSYAKNQEFLIEIFEKVKKRRESAWLLLVGAGDMESEIMDMVRQKNIIQAVTVLHHRKDIHRIMRAMDIFVFPSRHEGLGIVLIEAQASGLPCIISESIPDDAVVTNQVVRLGLEMGADVWADKILVPGLPEKYESDLSYYDIKNIMKQLEELYR